ncbi:MAG: helix-turn-helix domain-containing protein [Bacteroidota bacterium]
METKYTPWQEVATLLDVRTTLFEKWMRYGFISAFRNGDGLLVIGNNETERLKQVIRIARICNIDPKNILRWIADGKVSAIRISGQWLRLTRDQVDAPLEIVFTPENLPDKTLIDNQPSKPVNEVIQMLNLSHTYVYRWIRYKYIHAFRDEEGNLLIKESELQRNLNLADLSRYLDIGRVKIHCWISEGTVTGIKIGDIELTVSRSRVDSPYKMGIKCQEA